ncbi:MAG: Hpt domain-containing protein [Proteobacteria bacterium]|nr:Hpt domain-containing protein [Pseudomonadota bacterium]MBU1231477.1 Hpt domain-containing protein [Pseudomonadota bacterium]MBU1417017.1 Hpt domain-containing protein [Pseudomonadota bacterium]MBU1453713.1 Hpt domain-containing protein [Pseudomonadota bacterium]
MDDLKWDREFALDQAAEDEELLQELIEIFKESSTSDLANLKQGISKGDAAMSMASAHSIKGAAASLGLKGLRDLTAIIEADCREGSLRVATEKLSDLEKLLSLLQEL